MSETTAGESWGQPVKRIPVRNPKPKMELERISDNLEEIANLLELIWNTMRFKAESK